MKSKFKFILFINFFIFYSIVNCDENVNDSILNEPFVEKGFLILLSTKNYKKAFSFLKKASKTIPIKYDLRDLEPDSSIGLSYPDSVCRKNGWAWGNYKNTPK